MDHPRGDYIDGAWVRPSGDQVIRSVNPATDGDVVLEAPTDAAHAAQAVAAAHAAWPAWAALSVDDRVAALRRFARELEPRQEALARAITAEMGKTLRESRQEARSLVDRVNLVIDEQLPRVAPWTAPGVAGETRYHPLGVIAVIGPFNFPLHLVHSHVIPALATGNTVVVKFSERTPLAGQRYMEAWEAAGLPPVVNMVQGAGDVGRALLAAPELRGVAFTGSWPTGHAIEKALHERPEVLVALEMGGQNMAIVLDDADLDQALEGLLIGGFMTTGQRCTCTARVLVHRSVAHTFVERLTAAARTLTWGDPTRDVFMGPLASAADRDHVDRLCRAGVEAGAEVLLAAERRAPGAFRGPSMHLIAPDHDSDYTRHEVFGPDLAVTIVDDVDQAIDIVNASAYGLALSVFTTRRAQFEQVYLRTRVGCVNWNRSTNRASGAFPFGGYGRSGNFRPAGGFAVFNATFPVQVLWNEPGKLEGDPFVRAAMTGSDPVARLEVVHRIEEACEPYRIYPEVDPAGLVRIPLVQLEPPGKSQLSLALAEALNVRGFDATLNDTELKLRMPAGGSAAQETAEGLADALYAIRYLYPARFLGRRELGSHVPAGDGLTIPRSQALMARLVGGDFVPDDRKPPIVDLFRSNGPYLASVDDDPLVVFDAASQIASHAGGLNPPKVLEALWSGRFGPWPLVPSPPPGETTPELVTLAAALRRASAPDLQHVAFCNSGAEANELALRAAARQRPGRRAVVAFEGSFHGRSLLALHATWNPSKRLRFELEGHQARWAPWPTWDAPGVEPAWTQDDVAPWTEKRGADSRPAPSDPLLAAEHRALCAVEAALADDQVVAVITEPMQSEGGDRYATERFFACLRALTLAYGVPLILDEVQTGFHLGGPFFWHRRWNLPAAPDLITCAKKAQVGAVVSRWPIEAADPPHITSAVRGMLQAEMLAAAPSHAFEANVRERMAALAAKHPTTVLAPRATGWAFAFDLPDPKALAFLTDQRLWRGYMVYGAGDRTLRFRGSPAWTDKALDSLFQRLDESLASLEAGESTAWRVVAQPDEAAAWPRPRGQLAEGYRILKVGVDQWPAVLPALEALQVANYEPARRDNLDHFGALLREPGAVCLVAVKGKELPPRGTLVGCTFAFPLEHFAHLDGPRQDPMLGRGNTIYSADLTVHKDHQGKALGLALKQAQVREALQVRRPDGSPRFEYLTGRNRVGATERMRALNRRFGAWPVAVYSGQYGEPEGLAMYYRVPLMAPHLPESVLDAHPGGRAPLDLDGGLVQPLGPIDGDHPATAELRQHLLAGHLNGAIANKLSLCNFVTPGVVRGFEMLRALAPRGLGHLVLASGRAEVADKGLRALKYHRGGASVVISVGPVYAGDTTAAARSISLPEGHPDNWFGWPTTADPTRDPAQALRDLERCFKQHGPERVLGVVVEPVYLQTGRPVPDDFWGPLRAACDGAGVPLVVSEAATAGYRSGRGPWRADTLPIQPDALWWYPGGQLGLVFLSDKLHVSEKLTLISTWDGDEVSLTRLMWELRAARRLPVTPMARRLRELLRRLGPVHGEGLFLAVEVPNGPTLRARLADRGVLVGLTTEGWLRVAPALTLGEADLERVAEAVASLL